MAASTRALPCTCMDSCFFRIREQSGSGQLTGTINVRHAVHDSNAHSQQDKLDVSPCMPLACHASCQHCRVVHWHSDTAGPPSSHSAAALQHCTLYGRSRPYGLGLLVVGVDTNGPCLYETCPSGQFWQCRAMAMGARSQAAKTYLERNLDSLAGASQDELIKHVLLALQVRPLSTHAVLRRGGRRHGLCIGAAGPLRYAIKACQQPCATWRTSRLRSLQSLLCGTVW